MSQPGSPHSAGEVSPSVALLAACAPDHHQALDPSHFPDCEICLAARDYFIDKETSKKHHIARFLARSVAAPELPLGYAPTDLRTYRRPRVPGTPDPVQLLLPGRTRPVLPSHTPTPPRSPVFYAPTPLKRKRSLSFQEELQLERNAQKEDGESGPLGQPEQVGFENQSTPAHQIISIRPGTPACQSTPSSPDDETRGTSCQSRLRHSFDNPDFVSSPYHDPSIWDTSPIAAQPTATSSIPPSPSLFCSIHRTQPGLTSDIWAQNLKLIYPFGAEGRYVYGLTAPEPIRDSSPSPSPSCGMQFASRICGTAASIGSGAINFVSNAVNTLLGRPAPRHVPVDNAGKVVLPNQPVNQAPKRRRVDGSGESAQQFGEPSSAIQTRHRSGSPSSRREYGRTTSSSHPRARRAATASPNRQHGKSSAAPQFIRDVKSATPPHNNRDWMDINEPSQMDIIQSSIDENDLMDIDGPSLTDINAPTNHHVVSTIKHEQPIQQPAAQQPATEGRQPTVEGEQSIVGQSIIQEITAQQLVVDGTAIEQSPIEPSTAKQPVIKQPDILHAHPSTEPHAGQLRRDTIEELEPEQKTEQATTYASSEDEDSEDELYSAGRPIGELLPCKRSFMTIRTFQSPQERLRQKRRRLKKEAQRKKASAEFGPARDASRVPQYKSISEFFDNDDIHGIEGFFKHSPPLVPNGRKLKELEDQHQDRLRREEEERREAKRKAEEERREAARKAEEERRAAEREKLRSEQGLWDRQLEALGLRKPHATMITPISAEWNQKVQEALAGRSGKVKTPGPEVVELTARDFERLVPDTAWLNDSCVTAALTLAAKYINDGAGVILKQTPPKCVTLNTFFWSQLCSSGPKGKARMLKRLWGLTPENFLEVDTVIVPVNLHAHWSFLIVRPTRREIAYVDSFQNKHEDRIAKMHEFMEVFLEDRYDASEWKTVYFKVPVQSNTWDCGVFTITNTIYLAMGIDPSGYGQADMPLQRRRLAAAILNGGFTGDFDLSQL